MPDSGIAALPVAREDYEQFQNDETSRDAQQTIGTAFDHADAVAKVGAAFDDAQKQAEQHSTAQQAGEVAKAAAGKVYDAYQTASEDAKPYIDQIGQAFSRATKPDRDAAAYADQIGKAFAAAPAMPQGTAPVPAGGGEQERALALQAAQKYGLDPAVFLAQGQQESGLQHVDPATGNVKTSSAGALGAYQLMPETAKGLGVDPTDLAQNVEGGARLMRQLLDRYGGDYTKALAAYNAGPGAVDQAGGVPDFPETRAYVQRILSAQQGRGGAAGGGVGGAAGGGVGGGGAGRVDARGVEAQSQFGLGLPDDEAYSLCGPVAAIAFAQANGRNPTVAEAQQLARQVGWTPQGGMNGVQNEQALLTRMGVASRLDTSPDFGQIAQDASTGNPVVVSTDKHYYYVNGFDPATGKLHVGQTGTARKGGAEWMSAQEIADLDGGINGALFVDNPNSPHPSVGAASASNQGQFGAADEGFTADEGGQPVAPVESGADIAARMTGTGAKPPDPLGQPLDTSSVGGFLRSIVPGLLHLLGGGQATTPAPDTDATSPAITAPNGVPTEGSGIAPTSIGDAFKRAMDQAQSPDVPGLPLAGLPRLFPYQPGKPTQPPQDVSEKITTGQPLDAGDFVAGLTKTAMAQGTSPAAAAASEGLEDVVGPLAHVAGPMGPRIGTPEEDLARAFAQGRTEGSAAGGLGAGVRSAGEAAAGGGDALGDTAAAQARRMFHGTGSAFDTPEAAKFDPNGLFGPGYYLTSEPRVASSYADTRAGAANDIGGLQTQVKQFEDRLAFVRSDPYASTFGKPEQHPQVVAAAERDLANARANLADAESRVVAGPNVRAVDVPAGLKLFDTEAMIPVEEQRRIEAAIDPANVQVFDFLASKGGVQPRLGGEIYDQYRGTPGVSPAKFNDALKALGYDGIEYSGGKRIPLPDDAGNPIEHQAVVVFPESLPKLRNALSGTQGGQIDPRYAVQAATTAAGGVGGYATQEPQQPGESDAAYAARIAGATGAGALVGLGAGALGTRLLGGRGAGVARGIVDPAERAAMPAVDQILRQWDTPAESTGPGIAQQLEAARTFLVRKLTDRRVDLNQLQNEVGKLYGTLPADMQVSELSRLNPSGAATLRVQHDIAPVIREAGDDLPYVNTLLGARGNVDVAAATAQRVEEQALAASKPPPLVDIGPPEAPMIRSGVSERARTAPEAGPLDPARARALGEEAAMLRKFSGGVDAAASQRAMDEMEQTLGPERFQKVSDLADRIVQVNRDSRQMLVDSGRITQETADEWARLYPNYTPVQIVDYLSEQSGFPVSGQGKSLGVSAPAIHDLSEEGTERARLSPIASTINNAYAVENLAKQQATFTALKNWVDRVPEMAQRFHVVEGGYSGTQAERAVTGFVDGKKVSIVTPFADMAKVLRQEPGQTIPLIGPVMQVFKELITSRNPAFLVRNALMDFPVYLVRETARAGGMPADTARAIGRYVAAVPDAFSGLMSGEFTGPATQRYLAGGGSMESWAQRVRGPKDAERYVQELRRTGGIHVNGVADLARIARSLVTGETFKVVGERIELAPRVASFRAGEEAGLSPAQAVVRGRNVTVDFAEGGTWAKTLNQAVPFFNPAIQGGANLARAVYENPKGAGMTFALGLATPTLAIEAWNNADPERRQAYADVPNYVKDRGWVFMLPGPGGKGVLTAQDEKGNPTPQYLALNLREFAPVVDATRAAARTAFGAETRSWGDLLGGAITQVSPTAGVGDLTPVGAKTWVELKTDQDFYRGTRIATASADERASVLSKALAQGYNDVMARAGQYPNVRPSQLEYIGRENFGVLSQAASGASDIGTGKKAGSTNPQDIPVVGAFVRGNLGNATGQQLENAREGRLDPDVKRALYETGLIADVTGVPSDIKGVPLLRREQADYQQRANGHINDVLRRVLDDPAFGTLPPDVKKKLVQNVVQSAKTEAAGETLAAIGDAGVNQRLLGAKKAS